MKRNYIVKGILVLLLAVVFYETRAQNIAGRPAAKKPATLDEVLASKQDLWGIAAMQQSNGASYDYFANLLPPLRYVNAQFRYYPIILCAPGSQKKAWLISNGSAINPRPKLQRWKDVGTPALFFVGKEKIPFGEKFTDLDGPRYQQGYLPVVQLNYRCGGATYTEETFSSVDLPDNPLLFTRFNLKEGNSGIVTVQLESKTPLHVTGNTVCDAQDHMIVSFDASWQWDAGEKTLTAQLSKTSNPTLAIATVPLDTAINASEYDTQKKKCIAKWEGIIAGAMRVEVPETVVNNAWKSLIVGSFELLKGNDLNYSANNLYEVMYEAESGDAVRALLLWGLKTDSRRMIPPLLDYGINAGLKFHDAAFKLQLLAHYYWMTRDAAFIREQKSRWLSCVDILTNKRDEATGLLPREAYCGDEADKVFSLNSNSNAWCGLRDIATVLQQLGDNEEAVRINKTAETLKKAIIAAVDKSERTDVQPHFLPIALFGEEKPYDILTATRRGSYWDLMIPYVLGSKLFDGTERQKAMLRYLEEHGGICMGMIRFHQHSGLFANEDGIDDLFGLRYVDALLRNDEPERAIVSFYGKLAQGMTRDTYLNAEGTSLRPLDEFGRPMYMPPTSGGASFLWTLRALLVQDYDLDNNGEPETLRLLFATPRRWLENGKKIIVEHAPTSFGEVSVIVESQLAQGKVIANVTMPERNAAKRSLLRIRLPKGWKIASAQTGLKKLKADAAGTVDISTLTGKNIIQFKVKRG